MNAWIWIPPVVLALLYLLGSLLSYAGKKGYGIVTHDDGKVTDYYEDSALLKWSGWLPNWDWQKIKANWNGVEDQVTILHPDDVQDSVVMAARTTHATSPAQEPQDNAPKGRSLQRAIVVLCGLLLLGLCGLFLASRFTNARNIQASMPSAIPTFTSIVPTDAPALTATNAPVASPTVVPPSPVPTKAESMFAVPVGKGCMGDEWFKSGENPGSAPCALNAEIMSKTAGVQVTVNGKEIGGDKGWTQPSWVSREWYTHVCDTTVICVPPKEKVIISFRYDPIYLDLGDIYTPYLALLNAQMTKGNDVAARTIIADGVSLSAMAHNIPFLISYNGSVPVSTTSAQLAPGMLITVTFECTSADITCQYGIGQYGKLTDYVTGESTPEMQKLGGNNAVPPVLAPNYPGILKWIEEHSK